MILGCIIAKTVSNNTQTNGYTIVIDAGHGGRDGGSSGRTTIEKTINLEYTKLLKNKLTIMGYNVILTREDDFGLYDPLASNKKLSDMNNRMRIIKEANPNLVISIHMNSYPDSSISGCQVFYKIDDDASKTIADTIASSISNKLNERKKDTKEGDYYILNCSYYTSVLIECGYLSNPEDEIKLNDNNYKELFTNAIAEAVGLYFGELRGI